MKTEGFPVTVRNKESMLKLSSSHTVLEALATAVRQKKEEASKLEKKK
jgi:hypothetical protein